MQERFFLYKVLFLICKKGSDIMQNDKVDSTLVLLLSLAIVFSVGGVVLNYALLSSVDVPVVSISGRVTDSTSTVTLIQAGSAGITLTDAAIAFGSGYYNASCTTGMSVLESNRTYTTTSDDGASPTCWRNTTTAPSADFHTIQNNGSVKVNVSASTATGSGEALFCGAANGCPFTSVAAVALLSENGESNSCDAAASLTSGYESLLTSSSTVIVGICDKLDFQDSSDEIQIFAKVTVPKDATAGAKSLTIVYEALTA